MEVSRAFREVVISSRRTSGGFASFGLDLPVYVPSGGGIGGGVDIESDGSCMYVIGGCADNIMESNQSDLTGVRVMSSLTEGHCYCCDNERIRCLGPVQNFSPCSRS